MKSDSCLVRRRRSTMFWAGLWTVAALLPLLTHGMALVVNVAPSAWLLMTPTFRWSLAADAMLYTAACVVLAAPLAGVGAAGRAKATAGAHASRWRAADAAWPTLVAVSLFAIVSGALAAVWTRGQHDAVAYVLRSHATLIAVSLALAGWGAACGAWFQDPLDAAACSLSVALIAAGGLLVAGESVASLPRTAIAWGLTASPFVVIASSAHIDVFRTDLLYQISPLAHIQIDYPAWQRASAGYLAVALMCFFAPTVKFRSVSAE